jgi:hypothetical protein
VNIALLSCYELFTKNVKCFLFCVSFCAVSHRRRAKTSCIPRRKLAPSHQNAFWHITWAQLTKCFFSKNSLCKWNCEKNEARILCITFIFFMFYGLQGNLTYILTLFSYVLLYWRQFKKYSNVIFLRSTVLEAI